MSPTTTSLEGMTHVTPSRITLALGEERALRLSRDFSAFTYCTVPSTALSRMTAKMTMELSPWPDIREITAATIRIRTNRYDNYNR